jgi:hypothetical protein
MLGGGRSVGIFRWRTEAPEFVVCFKAWVPFTYDFPTVRHFWSHEHI